jgi:hypothetical protein
MTLSEKLKATLNELEQARVNGIEAQHNADLEKIRKERSAIKDKLDKIKDLFVEQIEAGKVPLKKIENYEWKDWVKASYSQSSKTPHLDLWMEFHKFWADEGLVIRITDGHDGAGMTDWINVSLVLQRGRPRSVGATDGDDFQSQPPNAAWRV